MKIKNKLKQWKKKIIVLLVGATAFAAVFNLLPYNLKATPVEVKATYSKYYNNNIETRGATSTGEFHEGWINWLDQDGWKDINTDFATTSKGFEMINAPFKVLVPYRSTGTAVFHNDNRFDVFTQKTINEPALDMQIVAQDVYNVEGKIVRGDLSTRNGIQKQVNYVVYENAYPEGDLIYYVDLGTQPSLQKLIKYNSKPADLTPSFTISYSSDVKFKRKVFGEEMEWMETVVLHPPKGDGLKVFSGYSLKRGIGFKNFTIWDSKESIKSNKNIQNIAVDIEKISENKYFLTKILPAGFFDTATYPVYTDTDSTFYPAASPGSPVDGRVNQEYGAGAGVIWGTIITDPGSAVRYDQAIEYMGGMISDNQTDKWRILRRGFIGFTFTGITGTVSSSTLSIYGAGMDDTCNINPTFNVYNSSASSSNVLINPDFTSTGNIAFSNTTITETNFDATGYNNYLFNATGRAEIVNNTTKIFSIKNTNYDAASTTPTWSSGCDTGWYAQVSETAGTSQDPKMTVTWATATTYVPDNTSFFEMLIRGLLNKVYAKYEY